MTIQNTMELLKAVKLLSVAGAKIAQDGKVSVEDLASLVEVVKEIEVITTAAKDITEIPEEFKDLDEEEVIMLVTEVFAIAKAVKEALK